MERDYKAVEAGKDEGEDIGSEELWLSFRKRRDAKRVTGQVMTPEQRLTTSLQLPAYRTEKPQHKRLQGRMNLHFGAMMRSMMGEKFLTTVDIQFSGRSKDAHLCHSAAAATLPDSPQKPHRCHAAMTRSLGDQCYDGQMNK